MRSWQGLIFGLLTGLLVGCASVKPIHSTAWLDRFRRGGAPAGPDIVQLDIALIERPIGDKYLNTGLWESADETIALETKETLANNGFRIGQIGGITPEGLQELLTSARSCANPRRIHLHAGKPLRLDLGPETAVCRFQLQRDGVPVPVVLETGPVHVGSRAGPGSRWSNPAAIRAAGATWPGGPSAAAGGRSLRLGVEVRSAGRALPALSWEVTLAPNEYVVIGGRFDLPQIAGLSRIHPPRRSRPRCSGSWSSAPAVRPRPPTKWSA